MVSRSSIILLANRDPRPLAPISESVPPPLLPIGGKPIIGHLLELIQKMGTPNISIVVHGSDQLTQAFIQKNWTNIAIVKEPITFSERASLVIRADVVPPLAKTEKLLADIGKDLAPLVEDDDFGLWFVRAGKRVPNYIDLEKDFVGDDRLLPNLHSYMRVAFAAAIGALPEIETLARLDVFGHPARVLTKCRPGVGGAIGLGAFIDRDVVLGERVIVGEGAMIGARSHLESTIVLPGSLVTPDSNLRKCIVSPEWVFELEGGHAQRLCRHQRYEECA